MKYIYDVFFENKKIKGSASFTFNSKFHLGGCRNYNKALKKLKEFYETDELIIIDYKLTKISK